MPRFATADLSGQTVTETVSRGKHLLTRTDAGITVHTHLRMDGSWRVRPAAERASGGHRIRLILANDKWQAVGYLLGVVEILPTAAEQRAVGHLGPDLLGPDWDPAEAERRLRADPARPVGEALLDQRNLAGIGNIYKAKRCSCAGSIPWRAGRRGRRPRRARRPRPAAARRATRNGQASVTTGSPAARRGNLGLRPGGPPVPPLRHAGPLGRPGPRPRGRGLTFWCPSCQS